MPTRRQLIQKITLNADTSSITFSNIPQNYTDLKIVISARDNRTAAAAYGYLMGRFNGSTTGFSARTLMGNGTGAVSNTYTERYFSFALATDWQTANTFGSCTIDIPNYTSSNNKAYKSFSCNEKNGSAQEDALILLLSGIWANTAAISSITLEGNSTLFKANSTFYLYGITQVPIIRGGEVSIAGGYKIHTFKNTASLQVIEGGDVEYLVIAGGGGGGGSKASNGGGGGGGAGGFRSGRIRFGPGINTVTVGAGGSGVSSSSNSRGGKGNNSSLGDISSTGGGGGGRTGLVEAGESGGSGGGGGYNTSNNSGGTGNQGSYSPAEGTNGGSSDGPQGGGGGGASSAGIAGGAGGAGSSSSISGSLITYAGGGGGASHVKTNLGGSGGGGTGGYSGVNNPSAGLVNSGSGGGGIYDGQTGTSGAGGSGIVIIRYPYDGN